MTAWRTKDSWIYFWRSYRYISKRIGWTGYPILCLNAILIYDRKYYRKLFKLSKCYLITHSMQSTFEARASLSRIMQVLEVSEAAKNMPVSASIVSLLVLYSDKEQEWLNLCRTYLTRSLCYFITGSGTVSFSRVASS